MSGLPTIRGVPELRDQVAAWRAAGETVALTPTMGALHAGHLSLVKLAQRRGAKVIASLFVNPSQFGPGEDFTLYPRDERGDAELLAAAGCNVLYAPTLETIYPPGFASTVKVGGLGDVLEGAARPGHFAGVATIVAKLLIQCAPDFAVFGEKDYQQLTVIRRLVRDLDLPMELVAAPIVRDQDGLALSSRNAYLSAEERHIAPALFRALNQAARAISGGAPVSAAEAEAKALLLEAGFDAVDYISARDPVTLEALGDDAVKRPARLLGAARLGRTRLLDNVEIAPGEGAA